MHNTNTSQGNATPSSMGDFDKLPRAMRLAMCAADHNWSGTQLLEAYRKRHPKVRTSALAVATIRQSDADIHTRDTSNPDFVGVMPRKAT